MYSLFSQTLLRVNFYRSFRPVTSDHGNNRFAGLDEVHSVGRISLLDDDTAVGVRLRDKRVGQIHSLVRLKRNWETFNQMQPKQIKVYVKETGNFFKNRIRPKIIISLVSTLTQSLKKLARQIEKYWSRISRDTWNLRNLFAITIFYCYDSLLLNPNEQISYTQCVK